jgi:hypothetical protein
VKVIYNYPLYPVCQDYGEKENWIIGVTAVNKSDVLSSFANYGSCVDLSAPGQNIYSTTYHKSSLGYEKEFDGPLVGTSFSAPLVSGSAALVKSIRPEWNAKEIIENLTTNANNTDSTNSSYIGKIGYGRLDVGKAAIAAAGNPSPLRGLDNLYFYKSNTIYQYNTSQEFARPITTVYGANFKSMVVADLTDDKQQEIILLLRRGIYDYIHILDNKGNFKNEFALSVTEPTQQINVSLFNAEEPVIIVERPQKDGKNSLFVKYNSNGVKVDQIEVKKPLKWQVTKNNELALSYLENGRLIIDIYDWNNTLKNTWSFKGFEKIYDMKTGRLWQNGGEQAVFTAKIGGKIIQYVVDLSSSASYKDDLGSEGSKEWKILAGSYGHSVVPYYNQGGNFSITDGLWGKIGAIKLPALKEGEWIAETIW